MSSLCPFSKSSAAGSCPMKVDNKTGQQTRNGAKNDEHKDSGTISPKCPFGYDSETFKLGPFSCMLCRALLYESSKCVPCLHKFCKVCISRFKDCPLCGADIEKIESDNDLQATVDKFIDGHARIKRFQVSADSKEVGQEQKNVIYGDVSMERGAFLVQQAMMAFHGKNVESAKSRLNICAEDIREQLKTQGNTPELCSQLGAVLGMLGDCCRTTGNTGSAVKYYEESADFLSKLPAKDLELVHTLSVSLNKIGDLRYYDGDLESARTYYIRALDVRRDAIMERSNVSCQGKWGQEEYDLHDNGLDEEFPFLTLPTTLSLDKALEINRLLDFVQIVDFAVSLAKVADVDRSLGNEDAAIKGFQEAIDRLESLKLNSSDAALKQRVSQRNKIISASQCSSSCTIRLQINRAQFQILVCENQNQMFVSYVSNSAWDFIRHLYVHQRVVPCKKLLFVNNVNM
ncbi:hypothetical protein IEQ34_002359 [Dendrobium chrysotoxum]|uniref:RING-type domain-containing protein n=1 Tax=Dendrobium chrysotoxum TaxID=161865 RepID=A0AAV7HN72_DENCH|nr:hypothetical protein IEQ34_002359 [Dendrobium chrysotoxum]